MTCFIWTRRNSIISRNRSYKRIIKNARNGLGIVTVQRNACGGCFNRVPPQRQLEIKMHRKVIVCEYCGRIMVDGNLVGVTTEIEAETQPKVTKRKSTKSTAPRIDLNQETPLDSKD